MCFTAKEGNGNRIVVETSKTGVFGQNNQTAQAAQTAKAPVATTAAAAKPAPAAAPAPRLHV